VTFAALLPVLLAGESGSRASYVGGTVPGLAGGTDGILQLTGEDSLLFRTRKATLEIPYERVNLLEYGQKASRRFAAAILVSPMLLLSKSRKHFLTVGYTDAGGQQQAVVLRIDKNHVRPVLAGLEAKTGRKVEYQDNEARRNGKG